jgi:hypothetical protein
MLRQPMRLYSVNYMWYDCYEIINREKAVVAYSNVPVRQSRGIVMANLLMAVPIKKTYTLSEPASRVINIYTVCG